MLYAIGTLCNRTPDSKSNDGTIAISWSGIKEANGFSGCWSTLSTGFSTSGQEGH